MHLRLSSTLTDHLKRKEKYIEYIWNECFGQRFQKPPFSLVFREKEAFSKCSTFKTVDGSLHVHKQKCNQNYAISNYNTSLVQMCNFYLAFFSLAQRHFYVHSTKELIMRRVVKKFNIPFREISRVFELLKIGSFKYTFRLDFHPTLASLNYFLLGHRRQSNARGLFGRKTSFDEDSITDQSSSRLLIPNNSRR